LSLQLSFQAILIVNALQATSSYQQNAAFLFVQRSYWIRDNISMIQ